MGPTPYRTTQKPNPMFESIVLIGRNSISSGPCPLPWEPVPCPPPSGEESVPDIQPELNHQLRSETTLFIAWKAASSVTAGRPITSVSHLFTAVGHNYCCSNASWKYSWYWSNWSNFQLKFWLQNHWFGFWSILML